MQTPAARERRRLRLTRTHVLLRQPHGDGNDEPETLVDAIDPGPLSLHRSCSQHVEDRPPSALERTRLVVVFAEPREASGAEPIGVDRQEEYGSRLPHERLAPSQDRQLRVLDVNLDHRRRRRSALQDTVERDHPDGKSPPWFQATHARVRGLEEFAGALEIPDSRRNHLDPTLEMVETNMTVEKLDVPRQRLEGDDAPTLPNDTSSNERDEPDVGADIPNDRPRASRASKSDLQILFVSPQPTTVCAGTHHPPEATPSASHDRHHRRLRQQFERAAQKTSRGRRGAQTRPVKPGHFLRQLRRQLGRVSHVKPGVSSITRTSAHQSPQRRLITVDPMTMRSILVRRKQSSASAGVLTIGSFSLNEVLSTSGTPVMRSNSEINRW